MVYDITDLEFEAFKQIYIESLHPLVIKEIPAKEKRKYIILCIVIHYFDIDKYYTEKEVNDILKPMLPDHVLIRRYLIDYQMMDRSENGSSYWLVKDPKEFKAFDLR